MRNDPTIEEVALNIDNVKELLSQCSRSELRDHAFGDREIYWHHIDHDNVATGYVGDDSIVEVTYVKQNKHFHFSTIDEKLVRELVRLGDHGPVERNDSIGPDKYQDGVTMPVLTKEGVLKELLM